MRRPLPPDLRRMRGLRSRLAPMLRDAARLLRSRPIQPAESEQHQWEHWRHFHYVRFCPDCWRRENARALRLARYFGYGEGE